MYVLKILFFFIFLHPSYGFCTEVPLNETFALEEIQKFKKDINNIGICKEYDNNPRKLNNTLCEKIKDFKALLHRKNATLKSKMKLHTEIKVLLSLDVLESIKNIKNTFSEICTLIANLSFLLSKNFSKYSQKQIHIELINNIFFRFNRSDCNKITSKKIHTLFSGLNQHMKDEINQILESLNFVNKISLFKNTIFSINTFNKIYTVTFEKHEKDDLINPSLIIKFTEDKAFTKFILQIFNSLNTFKEVKYSEIYK